MSIQKFPLAAIQKVRLYIQSSLSLPDTEQQSKTALDPSGELPEPESIDDLSGLFTLGGGPKTETLSPLLNLQGQWFISTVNPATPLLKLPGLRLKPDLRLVSYLYRVEGSGVGVVWAVPEALSTTAQLETALVGCDSISKLPKPTGALNSFMEAIDGDRSPSSFVIAAILRRELQEFGAYGDRRNWSYHQLIEAVPNLRWQWKTDQPKDFSPKARVLPDGQAVVEFFTCRNTRPRTLYRHLDQYPVGQYKSNSLDKSVAVEV